MALAKYAEEIQELIWEREAARERKATYFTTAAADAKQHDTQKARPEGANDRYCFITNLFASRTMKGENYVQRN